MLKPIKALLKHNRLYIAILIAITIAALSLIKLGKQPISFSNIDKVEHAIAYCFLTLSWLFAIKKAKKNTNTKIIIVASCIFYGIIIELLQATITTYRTADVFDMMANSVGALTALFIFNVFLKKRQVFNI